MMVKNILIDLDDTILDFKKAERLAVAKTLEEFGLEPSDDVLDRYHILNIAQWKALEKGLVTREQLKVKRYENLFNEFSIDRSPKEAARRYENNLGLGHFFLPGAQEFLLKAYKKYNLYLVSNGTAPVQDSRIKSAGIAQLFRSIYISEKIGLDKPSKEFFDYVFNDIKNNIDESFKKSETIIVGDSLTSDILGGINAGIKTVWFNPRAMLAEGGIVPDIQVKTHEEIFSIV